MTGEASVERFAIDVPDATLADLHDRLAAARWIRGLGAQDWNAGVDLDDLKEVVDYWRDTFDWRRQERTLNALAHFTARIDDYRVHFIRERGSTPDPVPLLLLHGWPDSFLRFHKIIALLNAPTDSAGAPRQSFDLVIPSLPGFGFTEVPGNRTTTYVVRHDARLLHRLMTETLGYRHYGIVGGDGGSPLAQSIAIQFPESVVGIYVTDLGWHASNVDAKTLSKAEQHYLASSRKAFMKEGAYAMVQATKPQTLVYNLNDSPVGLAAWILDRFHFWTDGAIEDKFTRDDLLTNITIYWSTQTIASSVRGYRAETLSPSLTPHDRVEVPVGLGLFPKDVGGVPPRALAERTLNVQHWTEMPRGGHFTAWEEPTLMADDVRVFFGALREQDVRAAAGSRAS